MSKLKLSKTSWLILSAGVFLVVLAGLGLTRSQQLESLDVSTEELGMATQRLGNLDTSDLKRRIEALNESIAVGQAQLDDAITRLDKSVISADVAEDFYEIAFSSNVIVQNFSSTGIASDELEGIPVSQTAVTASVSGTLGDVISFIINLNTSFRTGYIDSAGLGITLPVDPDKDLEAETSASIRMIIYSYEG